MTVIKERKCSHVSSTDIRNLLRKFLVEIGFDTFGIRPLKIDARSLRAGGATALLCANIDPNSIQQLGRWKSDATIRYLHIAASPHTQQYARQMLTHGKASSNPGTAINKQFFFSSTGKNAHKRKSIIQPGHNHQQIKFFLLYWRSFFSSSTTAAPSPPSDNCTTTFSTVSAPSSPTGPMGATMAETRKTRKVEG
jgi:hypothetical protein